MRACIHFIKLPDEKIELYFEHPIRTMIAYTPAEVKGVVEEAQQLAQTYYVVGYIAYEALHENNTALSRYAAFYVFDQTVSKSSFQSKTLASEMSFSMIETKEAVIQKIEAVKEEIRLGHTYQTNYTTRLTAEADVDAYSLYERLTAENNGGYTAYIESEEEAILSISPELFFQVQEGRIITKPMKGTMPRGQDSLSDKENYQALSLSAKDKAENVMIVDLLRNDLSRIAERNSVNVTSLFDITAYPTVYQMTSTVEASTTATLYSMLKALFPCGSITGAPKQRTMKIIESLEPSKRGVYCGAIGFLCPQYMIFNVPIRTLYKEGRQWTYGVGGGITIDSDAELEFQEMIAKTRIIRQLKPVIDPEFHLIETMRIGPSGIKRKAYHKTRLVDALNHFHMAYHMPLVDELFEQVSAEEQMMRITAYDGYISSVVKPLPGPLNNKAQLKLMATVHPDYLEYKTSVREHYNDELTLYYNAEEQITEFNIGNFVYEWQGSYYTPEVAGMLKGCMREELLEQGNVTIRNITLQEFRKHSHEYQYWMINSLREWVAVELEID